MFDTIGRFFRRTRRPVTIIATTFGGGYLALSYLRSKLSEMQESLTRTRVCTENLRRRFEQNQEDCSFTVLALIPTLGKQVIQSMNVEKLVEFLTQTKSRTPKPIVLDSKTTNCTDPGPTQKVTNGDSQPLKSNGDSQPLKSNGDSQPLHPNGDSQPLHPNGDSQPLHPNGDSQPLHRNGDSQPLHPNGDSQPLHPNGDSQPLHPNGDSQPLHPNGDSHSPEPHSQKDKKTNPENQLNQSLDHENPSTETHKLNGSIDESSLSIHKSPQSSQILEDFPEMLLRPDGTLIQKRSEIWVEMMLLSFTRLFTCLYGVTLLKLQTHIQLGLLGRDLYLSSIISSQNFNDPDVQGYDDCDDAQDQFLNFRDKDQLQVATERRYLTFSWWYLHKGWIIMSKRVRSAVTEVFSSKSLKDAVSLSDLQQIFDSIRKNVELEPDGSEFSFAPILLPSTIPDELETLKLGGMPPEDCEVDARLRSLLDETQDFIDCPDFRIVLSSAMNKIVDLCAFNVARGASLHPQEFSDLVNDASTSRRFTELELYDKSCQPVHRTARIVEILPVVSKESLQILNVIPNEYIDTLRDTRELKEFSSVIYTAFDGLTNKFESMTT